LSLKHRQHIVYKTCIAMFKVLVMEVAHHGCLKLL
jgi:hypothetical protein